MNHSIFISYSRADRTYMERICYLLRQAGFDVWTDDGIEPGTPIWKETISEAIKQCQSLVVLFSPDSAQSTWVNRELDFAELHDKTIYPFLLRGDKKDAIPFGFTTYQFIDARGDADDIEDAVRELLVCLEEDKEECRLASESSDGCPVKEAVPAQDKPQLWRWFDSEEMSFPVPESWTVGPVTEDSWRRAQLLLMGGESYFYRWIQDEDLFLYKATGIPGTRMDPKFVLSDITGLTPLVGFVATQTYPFPIPSIATPIGLKFCFGRFEKYLEERFSSVYSEHYWLEAPAGKILAMVSDAKREGNVYRGCSYMIFPPLSRHPINLHIGCEAERFERERVHFDRIAQSLVCQDK